MCHILRTCGDKWRRSKNWAKWSHSIHDSNNAIIYFRSSVSSTPDTAATNQYIFTRDPPILEIDFRGHSTGSRTQIWLCSLESRCCGMSEKRRMSTNRRNLMVRKPSFSIIGPITGKDPKKDIFSTATDIPNLYGSCYLNLEIISIQKANFGESFPGVINDFASWAALSIQHLASGS